MYLPKLWSLNNDISVNSTKYIFKKHVDLLKCKPNLSILEIGSGDGNTTIEALLPNLPKDRKELILSDKSPEMVQYAQTRPELSKIQYVQLDIESNSIPDGFRGKFDNIFSMYALHFVRDTRRALQNIYDMLKPSGEAFVTFLSPVPCDYAWKALGEHPKWSKYDPNPFVTRYFGNSKVLEIYQKHLEDCKFKNVTIFEDDWVYDVNNLEEFKNIVKATNLSLRKIPEELQEEYLEDYYELFRKDELWSFKTENGTELISTVMKIKGFHVQK